MVNNSDQSDYLPPRLFHVARRELLDSGFRINWHDRSVYRNIGIQDGADNDASAPKKDRVKFTYPRCAQNCWAKPPGCFYCGLCNLLMLALNSSSTSFITAANKETYCA